MKIKKIKVNLRQREITRNLKLSSEIKEITPQFVQSITEEMEKANEYFTPAAIFDTFTSQQYSEKIDLKIVEHPDPVKGEKSENLVAVSLAVVTVGDKIEQMILDAQNEGKHLKSQIIQAVGLEGCNQAVNLVYRLFKEEAGKEECEISSAERAEKSTEKKVVEVLNSERIGVHIDDKNQLHPMFTSIVLFKWFPKKTKKK